MTRIHIICEGLTERVFVNRVMKERFAVQGIYLFPALLGVTGHKGGNVNFARLSADVVIRLKEDENAFCTTLIDYYGSGRDFPGRAEAERKSRPGDKQRAVQDGLKASIVPIYRGAERRFIPYVQMYEFEGLLFSDTTVFAASIGQPDLKEKLSAIRSSFETPEFINEGSESHPSRRIKSVWPGYNKSSHGQVIAEALGLAIIRRECPLFNEWVTHLEALAGT
jgi:hypothetical protein